MESNTFAQPKFNFNKFSKEKQEQLWQHFWPEMEHFDDEPTREHHINLIYLAWLWANGFVNEDPNHTMVDDRITDFNYDNYLIDDFGFNLYETCEMENLRELFPLLKDSEVEKLSKRVEEN